MEESRMYFYDFVIMFALVEEFEQFKRALCAYKSEIESKTNGDDYFAVYFKNYGFYKNKNEIDEVLLIIDNETHEYKKFRIYAKTQNISGMISAAICATNLIYEFRPKHIVLLGIAAGLNKRQQEFGSVLIGDFVFPYQQGKLESEGLVPDGGGLSLNQNLRLGFKRNCLKIIADVQTAIPREKMNQVDLYTNGIQINNITAEIGIVATSIQVIAVKKEGEIIKRANRKAIGLEMEGYGVFQAAEEAAGSDIITTPIIIKSVSDYADEWKSNHYRKLAGFTSSFFFIKFLECHEMQPEPDLPYKSNSKLIPLGFNKYRNEAYEKLIKNASKNSFIHFISITANSDLKVPEDITQNKALQEAFVKKNKFRGIVVNPEGYEALFRSNIETPDKPLMETLLYKGAVKVKESLKEDFWKNVHIEMRYARVGLSFKLWLTDKAALIEPYHFGRNYKEPQRGLCGFSQIIYTNNDKEYKILKDHFNQLWLRADPFWPEKDKIDPWDSEKHKKEEIFKKIKF